MKKLLSLALSLLLLLSVTACGKKASKKLDVEGFTAAVLAEDRFGDELLLLGDAVIADFYTLPEAGVVSARFYLSATAATASEFVVLELTDETAVTAAKEMIQKRIEAQTAAYADYRPEEKFRLENALVAVEGNDLVFAVSNDNDKIASLFTEYHK